MARQHCLASGRTALSGTALQGSITGGAHIPSHGIAARMEQAHARVCPAVFEVRRPLGTITALSHSPKDPPCPGLNCLPPPWG
ncbi:hypothetical protein METHPM2_770024 [Pseudomonas sp. PM2]